MENIKQTTVNIYERQVKWIIKNHFKLSPFIREILDKEIKKREG